MPLGSPTRLIMRMGLICLITSAVCYRFPTPVVQGIAPAVRLLTAAISPYIDRVQVSMEDKTIYVTCRLWLQMTGADGSPLPAVRGEWNRSAWPSLQLIVVALTAWIAPAMPLRNRLCALPVALVSVIFVAAFQLSIELQVNALDKVGSSWLQSIQPVPSEENLAYFKTMGSWLNILIRMKNINFGGGALFLAVLSGLIGYALPAHIRPRQSTPPGCAISHPSMDSPSGCSPTRCSHPPVANLSVVGQHGGSLLGHSVSTCNPT